MAWYICKFPLPDVACLGHDLPDMSKCIQVHRYSVCISSAVCEPDGKGSVYGYIAAGA
jgi:hypothetical protein